MALMYLVLPKLEIENANALSSPYTIGFPAMTAWLGTVHALERKLHTLGWRDVKMKKSGVVNHGFALQTFRAGYNDSIIGTGNPLTPDGKRPPFVPEARCHLTVSVIIACSGLDPDEDEEFQKDVQRSVMGGLRFAGGSLVRAGSPLLVGEEGDGYSGLPREMLKLLMPGFALISRRDLLLDAQRKGEDQLDALLTFCAIHHFYDEESEQWNARRREPGWIVPIGVGFQGICEVSPPGTTKFQRDPTVPHRFAETVVSLGEFVMPYRFSNVDELMWHYEYLENENLYLCVQDTIQRSRQGA